MESPIARFFEQFAQKSNSNDVPSQVSQFADTFLAAGPQGVQCVQAAQFALALPKRKQFFDSLGLRATTLVSLEEIPLDGRYVLVRTQWQMTFSRQSADLDDVQAESTFLVDTASDDFKIMLYLAHQDIVQVLKQRGIPAERS